MSRLVSLALGLALALAVAAPAHAADEVFTGELACAFCTLKKADARECQDVLLVTSAQGAITEYYIVKNEVAEKAGETCQEKVPATVTGSVVERDGKKWLTASRIEKQKK